MIAKQTLRGSALSSLLPSDFDHLEQRARRAIQQHVDRVTRAEAAGDVEGIIGASKELVESVAKAVIDALGEAYPSSPDLPALGKLTLEALKLHPSGLQGRESLQRLSGAYLTALNALAHLRNTDGTGHGRAEPSDLNQAHAQLARDAAASWCRWVLAAARRVLEGRAAIDEAIRLISGERTFRRGELPDFLADEKLLELGEEDQHKFGLAVGRRWNVNQTFNVRDDVIEPMALGEETYPSAFAAGVVEGLFIDYLGYVQTTENEVDLLVDIGLRLPDGMRQSVFEHLVALVEQADASFVFEPHIQRRTVDRLRAQATSIDEPFVADALMRMANRIEEFMKQTSAPEEP